MTESKPPEQDDRQVIASQFTGLIVMLGLFALLGIVALLSIVMGGSEATHHAETGREAFGPADFADQIDWAAALNPVDPGPSAEDDQRLFQVPPPPFSEDIYPCTECHDPEETEIDTEARELEEMHDDIELHHGPEDRWCFDCHNPTDRDKLRLVNGSLVGFDESYRLCGQCHGTIFRDWRHGIHGRRSGNWNGRKTYLLCAHCHNPHSPRFQQLQPLPPPIRPQYLRTSGESHE